MSEFRLVCSDFDAALELLRGAGLRIDCIYPADAPHGALLTSDGWQVRLTSRPDADEPTGELPPFEPEFVLTPAGGGAGAGRAGMFYRDLIPSRLGGRYIASHITIADGGPVGDWVHYHRIALQFLYVVRGWVRVEYEDQGDPFVLNEGDLVLQPPGIRHRVLENSPGLEVVEIAAPALHATFTDHEMTLPTSTVDPERDFSGQRFLRHIASDTPWTGFAEGEAQETAMIGATGGLAEVRTLRSFGDQPIEVPAHEGELVFGYVLAGSGELDFRGSQTISAGDAFVIPPDEGWSLRGTSDDFRLLYVATARLG